jgi:hypothetical protein
MVVKVEVLIEMYVKKFVCLTGGICMVGMVAFERDDKMGVTLAWLINVIYYS